jgi:hypothetical protein
MTAFIPHLLNTIWKNECVAEWDIFSRRPQEGMDCRRLADASKSTKELLAQVRRTCVAAREFTSAKNRSRIEAKRRDGSIRKRPRNHRLRAGGADRGWAR